MCHICACFSCVHLRSEVGNNYLGNNIFSFFMGRVGSFMCFELACQLIRVCFHIYAVYAVLGRLQISWSSVEARKMVYFWWGKQFSLFPVTLPISEMAECHMEWKKRAWDTALQAQLSYRASEAPLQSSAFLGIVQILLEHVPPSRKSGVLSVGGFIEFQHSLDGTDWRKSFWYSFQIRVLDLISGEVYKNQECR